MKAGKRDTLGEGHHKLSWIWEGAGADPDTSTGMHEGKAVVHCLKSMRLKFNPALHVQWARPRARVQDWTKEVSLLKEEMR